MGERGPIGKDPARRAGHQSKAARDAHESLPPRSDVTVPEPRESWHESARAWYEALSRSAISDRYEPSDWALAGYTCELLTAALAARPLNGALLRIIQVNMSNLGTSVGDRRRMQLEVRRSGPVLPENVLPGPGYERDHIFGP